MKGPRILIDRGQAEALVAQFGETAAYRGWGLLAAAAMTNHVHLVVTAPGDPGLSDILGDFKGYGSRVLNRRWGRRPNGTWWTEGGSKRKLGGPAAAVAYVRRQATTAGRVVRRRRAGGRQPPEFSTPSRGAAAPRSPAALPVRLADRE